jgi:hypothetical protein
MGINEDKKGRRTRRRGWKKKTTGRTETGREREQEQDSKEKKERKDEVNKGREEGGQVP